MHHHAHHGVPTGNYGGVKKRMKSKKSGGHHGGGKSHHVEGTSGLPDHGFHNHQFDQRNVPATAHHGIVGIKHQASSGTGSSLPLVVKTAGGS